MVGGVARGSFGKESESLEFKKTTGGLYFGIKDDGTVKGQQTQGIGNATDGSNGNSPPQCAGPYKIAERIGTDQERELAKRRPMGGQGLTRCFQPY
jgi:hypothetical protein